SASSTHEDSYWKWGLALVNDGNRANSGPQAGEYTGYCSSQTPAVDHAEWLMLDLGSLQTVNTVVIYSGATFDGERWLCYGFPDSYSIEVSTDKKTWKTVYQENSAELAEYGAFVYAFEDVEARYIRLNATSLRPKVSDSNSYRLQISEFEVYAVRELSSVDTEAVRNAIVSGEALLTDACYLGATADAKASYQLALDTLKELYADANALPSEAEAAIEALALAKTQLETNRAPIDTTPDTTEKDPDVTTPVTTDGGNDPIDPNDPDDPDDTPSVGLIIGILVGVLVIAGVAVGILLWKKKKSAQ
ncbi:MAG: discoidin domain-containing protein, partial [Clostridia bacterium]|nr:discoidin domain-containing protein [Clostridia bacterium]